jgi:DNA-binding transcriptional regulator PaaX
MPPKRPAKVKSSIAKLRGVDRERALHAEYLIAEREYARESADLLAYVTFPLDDDVAAGKAFAADIGSLSMDVAAFAESSTPGAAVHAAVMAVHAFRDSAESHREDYYVRKLDRLLVTLPSIEARFGD